MLNFMRCLTKNLDIEKQIKKSLKVKRKHFSVTFAILNVILRLISCSWIVVTIIAKNA